MMENAQCYRYPRFGMMDSCINRKFPVSEIFGLLDYLASQRG